MKRRGFNMRNCKLLTISQYAKEFGVTRSTVYKWIKENKLETVEIAVGVRRVKVEIKEEKKNGE